MAIVMDGKMLAKSIESQVKTEVTHFKEEMGVTPKLAAILVGEDPGSKFYVNKKKRTAKRLGMGSEVYTLSSDTSQEELCDLIDKLNFDDGTHGILVQLPLPEQIDVHDIADRIYAVKDVDGLAPYNIAKLQWGEKCLMPCTPKGIMKLLGEYERPISGKHAVVVGRSEIVGNPIRTILSSKGVDATVTQCNSRTRDLRSYTERADILIAAVGKPEFIKGDMIKKGAVVIDVGINKIDDNSKKGYHLVGDVHYDSAFEKAAYLTPVPGGVGPLTVACLMENTLIAAEMQTDYY